MGAVLMVLIHIIATRRNFPVEAPIPRAEILPTIRDAFPALLLPVILLGGIYSGAVTPTEAAAVAAAYALLLALGFYRALGLAELLETLIRSAKSTAIVAITILGALFINYVVASEQIPVAFGAWIAESGLPAPLFMLLMNLVFLLLGCFLDTLLMLLVIVPIVIPSVRALGIDTVHFGVVIVVNMMIGLITPLRRDAVPDQRRHRHPPPGDPQGDLAVPRRPDVRARGDEPLARPGPVPAPPARLRGLRG